MDPAEIQMIGISVIDTVILMLILIAFVIIMVSLGRINTRLSVIEVTVETDKAHTLSKMKEHEARLNHVEEQINYLDKKQ